MRFWPLEGPDEAMHDALRERRFRDLPRLKAGPEELRWRTPPTRSR
ncbi:hypothetical protein [Amycolatopsis sp.]|nr:hypothetical protein [Amycolatopsis sp.]